MKILHVIPGVAEGFGGPSNALVRLTRCLSRAGHEVTVFTTDADVRGRMRVPLGQPVQREGAATWYFPMQCCLRYKISFPLARALRERVKEFDAVHIHALFQFPTLAAWHYCQKAGVPYLIRPLGHLDPYALRHHGAVKGLYLRAIERRGLEGAWGVHFTTDDEQRLASSLGLHLKGIVVGLGFDTDEFSTLPGPGAFRSKYPALSGKKVILFLGRINFKKGLDILVQAYAELLRSRDDARLVIAGPDNEGYAASVVRWLEQEGIRDKAVFTGMLAGKEKLEALADSDIFVLPSYSENFGMSVVEAMAAGVPVVVSDKVNLAPEVAASGAGVVVGTTGSEVCAGIMRLLSDDNARVQAGAAGRRAAWERYSMQHTAEKLIEVYAQMRESRCRAPEEAR